MKRGKPLQRRTPVRKVNRSRAAETFARNFGERGEPVRAMQCLVRAAMFDGDYTTQRHARWLNSGSWCGDHEPRQAAHVRARGMGGCKGDRRDLVPLCAKHHAEASEFGTSQRADFERQYGLDLTAEAARIAAELDERGIP